MAEEVLAAWTVARLRKWLSSLPDDYLVVVAADAEGNAYNLVRDAFTYGVERTGGGYTLDLNERSKSRAVVLTP